MGVDEAAADVSKPLERARTPTLGTATIGVVGVEAVDEDVAGALLVVVVVVKPTWGTLTAGLEVVVTGGVEAAGSRLK